MKDIRLTEDQFAVVIEALRFDDRDIVKASQKVLVEGCKQMDVAREYGKHRQVLSAAIGKILDKATVMGYKFFSITVKDDIDFSELNEEMGVWRMKSSNKKIENSATL